MYILRSARPPVNESWRLPFGFFQGRAAQSTWRAGRARTGGGAFGDLERDAAVSRAAILAEVVPRQWDSDCDPRESSAESQALQPSKKALAACRKPLSLGEIRIPALDSRYPSQIAASQRRKRLSGRKNRLPGVDSGFSSADSRYPAQIAASCGGKRLSAADFRSFDAASDSPRPMMASGLRFAVAAADDEIPRPLSLISFRALVSSIR